MSKSRNNRYRDNLDDMDYELDPYERKSEYLEKKRSKRMRRALKTKDIDMLLQQNDDYDDNEYVYDFESHNKYNYEK